MITPYKLNYKSALAGFAFAFVTFCITTALPADTLDNILRAQAEADTAAEASQERIDGLYDGELEDANKYRQAVADTESFKQFISNQQKQVNAQRKELESIQQQLSEIERTQREVEPLMQRMLATLEQFIALDVPFLLEDGQVVGRLVFERLLAVPEKLYGLSIGSSYQRQGLALSKHFRP